MSNLSALKEQFETNLKQLVLARTPENLQGLHEMVSYHFGWNDPTSKGGKRLRPMFLLTSSQMFGGNLQDVMPAAVAMEVLHNYTLVHDDIEDLGDTRHGRECLWRKYGLAQALNTGDFLSTMAHDIFYEIASFIDPDTFARAYAVFRQAALDVIRGQYLDMDFETREIVSVSQYLEMIRLKTSCLISASIRIGAILAGVDEEMDSLLLGIGEHAGLAFQIQDDYLGIWGDSNATGKSNLTDLITRKKTYPVLLGLDQSAEFKEAWDANPQITSELSRQLAQLLCEAHVDQETSEAVLCHMSMVKEGIEKISSTSNHKNSDLWNLLESAFTPTSAPVLKPGAPI